MNKEWLLGTKGRMKNDVFPSAAIEMEFRLTVQLKYSQCAEYLHAVLTLYVYKTTHHWRAWQELEL